MGHYFNSRLSDEYGIGIYAIGYALKSYVTIDQDLGTVCYGCKISEEGEKYVVEPRDGLRVRILVYPLDIDVRVEKGHTNKLIVSKSRNWIELSLEKVHLTVKDLIVKLSGLSPGRYAVYVDEALLTHISIQNRNLNLQIPAISSSFSVKSIKIYSP